MKPPKIPFEAVIGFDHFKNVERTAHLATQRALGDMHRLAAIVDTGAQPDVNGVNWYDRRSAIFAVHSAAIATANAAVEQADAPRPSNLPTIGKSFCGPSPEATAKAIEVSHAKPRTCGECFYCTNTCAEFVEETGRACGMFHPRDDAQKGTA